MSEVKISKTEYTKIQRQLAKLNALESGGVNNWEWYGESLSDWFAENEVDGLLECFVGDINKLMVDAEIDERPTGRGWGYSITFDEEELKRFALNLCEKYTDIQKNK